VLTSGGEQRGGVGLPAAARAQRGGGASEQVLGHGAAHAAGAARFIGARRGMSRARTPREQAAALPAEEVAASGRAGSAGPRWASAGLRLGRCGSGSGLRARPS
jgi:hypothetical protein